MKNNFISWKTLVLAAALLSASAAVAASEFDDLMKQASEAKNLSDRYALWDKAVSVTKSDAEKYKAAAEAFSVACDTKDGKNIGTFGFLIAENPAAPAAARANAMFHALKSSTAWQSKTVYLDSRMPASFWEKYLEMPDKKEEQELIALQEIAVCYKNENEYAKAEKALKRVLAHPSANVHDKVNAALALTDFLLETGRQAEAIACIEDVLKLPDVPAPRRQDLLLKKSDAILSGDRYYFTLSEADFDAACKVYEEILAMKGAPQGKRDITAVKLADSYLDRKKYREAYELCDGLIKDRRNQLSQDTWNKLQTIMGHAQTALKDYEGAIETFERLRDLNYNPGDTCRFLGLAYYKNKDYTLAIGCYDMALEALKQAEDDRPLWCKGWISKIKWFTNEQNARELDKLMTNRAAKIEAAAKAAGQEVPENAASQFKSASDGTRDISKARKKKEIQSIEDIDDKGIGISDDGIDLDDLLMQ